MQILVKVKVGTITIQLVSGCGCVRKIIELTLVVNDSRTVVNGSVPVTAQIFGSTVFTTMQTWNVYWWDCGWGQTQADCFSLLHLGKHWQAEMWVCENIDKTSGCLAELQQCWSEEYLQWPSRGARRLDRVSGPEHLQQFCQLGTFICNVFSDDKLPLCWAEGDMGNINRLWFCWDSRGQTLALRWIISIYSMYISTFQTYI